MICALEIVGLVGPIDRSIARVGVIKGLLCEPLLRKL